MTSKKQLKHNNHRNHVKFLELLLNYVYSNFTIN